MMFMVSGAVLVLVRGLLLLRKRMLGNGSSCAVFQAVVCVCDMNALLDRFHNFILPRMRGPERVCHCTCGRHRVEYVIPYEGSVGSSGAGSVSKQELDLVLGLLMGFCISWMLLWLDAALRFWRSSRHYDGDLWRWVWRVCNLQELRRRLQTEDTENNTLHHKHKLSHNGHRRL